MWPVISICKEYAKNDGNASAIAKKTPISERHYLTPTRVIVKHFRSSKCQSLVPLSQFVTLQFTIVYVPCFENIQVHLENIRKTAFRQYHILQSQFAYKVAC